jgi:hypothetical protein
LAKTKKKSDKRCHDCDCLEGELHDRGCDMERCPFCGGQLISCDCIYKMCGFPDYKGLSDIARECGSHEAFVEHMRKNAHVNETGLPDEIYVGGPTDEMNDNFDKLLEEKGRIPYIVYPLMCGRCGVLWPDFFNVPDEEWEHYIRIEERRKILCEPCYKEIKDLIDTRSGRTYCASEEESQEEGEEKACCGQKACRG